jgi:hypothetical protein
MSNTATPLEYLQYRVRKGDTGGWQARCGTGREANYWDGFQDGMKEALGLIMHHLALEEAKE